MSKRNWITAGLSVTLSVYALAGCGQSPSAPATHMAPPAGLAAAPSDQAIADSQLAAQDSTGSGDTSTSKGDTGSSGAMPGTNADSGGEEGGAEAGAEGGEGAVGALGGVGGLGGVGAVGAVGGVDGVVAVGETHIGAVGGGIVPVVGVPGASFVFGACDLVPFQSNLAVGGGGFCGFDIFVYDAAGCTVLALPGVNTPANETNPRLSTNGEWLVYQSDQAGTQDILLFNLHNQLINTLRTLNTGFSNEREPDVSDDGNMLVYVSDEVGCDELRVYDMRTGNNFIVPVANAGLSDITWPTISGNGCIIAYGASAVGCDSDIFMYSLASAAQLTPPFLNTAADEYNPDLNELGSDILYVSNRRGSQDIYRTDMLSGFTDNLVLANTPAIEDEPRFLGLRSDAIVFQTNRTGNYRILAYDLNSMVLDTLPIVNEPVANTMLRNAFPKPGIGIKGGGATVGGSGIVFGDEAHGGDNVVVGGIPDDDP